MAQVFLAAGPLTMLGTPLHHRFVLPFCIPFCPMVFGCYAFHGATWDVKITATGHGQNEIARSRFATIATMIADMIVLRVVVVLAGPCAQDFFTLSSKPFKRAIWLPWLEQLCSPAWNREAAWSLAFCFVFFVLLYILLPVPFYI